VPETVQFTEYEPEEIETDPTDQSTPPLLGQATQEEEGDGEGETEEETEEEEYLFRERADDGTRLNVRCQGHGKDKGKTGCAENAHVTYVSASDKTPWSLCDGCCKRDWGEIWVNPPLDLAEFDPTGPAFKIVRQKGHWKLCNLQSSEKCRCGGSAYAIWRNDTDKIKGKEVDEPIFWHCCKVCCE
jgi:hypothetical protein